MANPTVISALLLLISALLYLHFNASRKNRLPYPPTPPGWPLVGNTFQVPKEFMWNYFSAVSRELDSPIIHLEVGGGHFVVFNDSKTAREVLETHGKITADRPKQAIWNRLSHNLEFSARPYGEDFKVGRKNASDLMTDVKNGETEALQTTESLSLLLAMLATPKDYIDHFARYALSLVFSLSFGLSIPSTKSPIYRIAHEIVLEVTLAGTFGEWVVDFFPFLDEWKWLNDKWDEGWPFGFRLLDWVMPWRVLCEKWWTRHTRFYDQLTEGARTGGVKGWKSGVGGGFSEVREDVESGSDGAPLPRDLTDGITDWPNGVVPPQTPTENSKLSKSGSDGREHLRTWSNILRDPFSRGLDGHVHGGMLIANMYQAGADTTAIGLEFVVLAALLHPDAVKRVQEELDSVIGTDRLPRSSDQAELPWLNAFVQETCRWRPVSVLGIPHSAQQDFEYNGYCIPKGAVLFSNIWQINRDPALFPDEPEEFKPERHITTSEDGADCFVERGVEIFGYGRRRCPGEALARRSLFLITARLLWAFDFLPAPDPKTGKIEKVDPFALKNSLAPSPMPFAVNIHPRDTGRAEVIKKEWADAPKELSELLPPL